MIEANRWKLGVFILIGICLIVGGILFFGVSQFLIPKITIETIFRDSIDGLKIGSPVKYSGVNLGSVSDISIRTDGYVAVKMELNLNSFEIYDTELIKNKMVTDPDYISSTVRGYVRNGYRCILQLRGITGEKFISIKHFSLNDKDKKLADFKFVNIPKDALYIPSVPSLVSGAADNVSKVLDELSDINFVHTVNKIDEGIVSIDQLAIQIKSLIGKIQGENVNSVFMHTAAKLDAMVDSVTELCNQLSKQPNSIIRGNEQEELFRPSDN